MTHAHLLVLSPYLVTSSSAFDRKKDWHWLRVKSTGGMQIKCERKENISVSSASMPWYTQDVYDTYPLIALTSRGSPLAMPASMKFQILLASSSELGNSLSVISCLPISPALMPSNPKTVVITTPGEIAAFSSLPPLDLLKLRSPAALSPTVPSLTA